MGQLKNATDAREREILELLILLYVHMRPLLIFLSCFIEGMN